MPIGGLAVTYQKEKIRFVKDNEYEISLLETA